MKSPRKNDIENNMSETKSTNQFSTMNKFDYPALNSTKNLYTNKSPTNKIDKFTHQKR